MVVWMSRGLATFGGLIVVWFVAFQPLEFGTPALLLIVAGVALGLRFHRSLPGAMFFLVPALTIMVVVTPMFLSILGSGTGVWIGLFVEGLAVVFFGAGLARAFMPAQPAALDATSANHSTEVE